MGLAPVYRADVRGGTSAPLPGVDAAAMGAGVARSLGEVGAAVERLDLAQRAVQRNEDWAAASVAFEDVKAKAEEDARRRREGQGESARPGWAGHADVVAGEARTRMQQFLDGIGDADVRRQMGVRVAAFESDLYGREQAFEGAKRLEKLGADTQAVAQAGAQRVLLSEDFATDLPAAVGDLDAYIDGLNVAPDVQEGLRRDLVPQLLDAGVQNRINAGELDAAEKMVKSEAFAELGPKRSQALLDEIAVERRRLAAADRARQAEAEEMAREALATQKAQLDTGAGTPKDWEALATGYEAIGDTSAAAEARAKGTEMAAVQGTRDYTVPQMQAEIAKLEAKQRGGGGLTPGEASMLSGLKTQRAQTEARLNRSGGALEQYQYATGTALPPIDLNDPATMQRRARYAASAAARYGRPTVEPLTEAELPGLRQLMEGGPGDKMRVLETLAGFGDPRAIEGAARQVAGGTDQGAFRIAATFLTSPGGRQNARDILRGGEALKANPSLYDAREARAAFAAYGQALQGLGPDFAADTLEAARNLYGSRMAAQGLTGWSEPEFRNAIDAALGGYTDGQHYKGGSWTYKGQRVLIPSGWTADGVFRRIARMNGEDLGKARASGAGRWPDGSPIYTGQLREMIPVYLGGTRYGFRSERSGRLLGADGGGPFVLDVAKVPWR